MSWLMVDYACPACGTRSESLEKRDQVPAARRCSCGKRAERAISAPAVKLQRVFAVSMGKSDPLPPHVPDFRTVGEGEPVADFRARRKRFWRERARKRDRHELGS